MYELRERETETERERERETREKYGGSGTKGSL